MYVEFMTLKNAQFLRMNLSRFLLTSFTIAIIPTQIFTLLLL